MSMTPITELLVPYDPGSLTEKVARRKALASVMEEAKVTDTNGETVDLSATIDTGDVEDDDVEASDDDQDGADAPEPVVTGTDEAAADSDADKDDQDK